MEMAGPDAEFLVFTGDGDFEYLIRKVVEKGTKVYVVSSNAGERKPGMNTKRFSYKVKGSYQRKQGENQPDKYRQLEAQNTERYINTNRHEAWRFANDNRKCSKPPAKVKGKVDNQTNS